MTTKGTLAALMLSFAIGHSLIETYTEHLATQRYLMAVSASNWARSCVEGLSRNSNYRATLPGEMRCRSLDALNLMWKREGATTLDTHSLSSFVQPSPLVR